MRALRKAVNGLYDRVWDARLGIATAGTDFGPTPYRIIQAVFNRLQLQPSDQLVDFGSGRGRILCYAATYPITRVAGVEIGREAVEQARRNIASLRLRAAREVSVVHGSAPDFDCSGGTVYYFANPFEEPLFLGVLDNIRASLKTNQRDARIVYYNPMRRSILDRLDWLRTPEVLHTSHTGSAAILLYRPR
jgi:tRNA A58 N-methylase Trm61